MKSCSPGGWLAAAVTCSLHPSLRMVSAEKTCLAQGDTSSWGPILPGPTSARILRSKLPSPSLGRTWWASQIQVELPEAFAGCITACIFLWSRFCFLLHLSAGATPYSILIHLPHPLIPIQDSAPPEAPTVNKVLPGTPCLSDAKKDAGILVNASLLILFFKIKKKSLLNLL